VNWSGTDIELVDKFGLGALPVDIDRYGIGTHLTQFVTDRFSAVNRVQYGYFSAAVVHNELGLC
jgi:hypothetical protein